MRTTLFSTGHCFHIFNRGVDKRSIFLRRGHYQHFLQTIQNILDTGSASIQSTENQSLALNRCSHNSVQLLCYCLMPNHYHLLLKQTEDNGISQFMHSLDTSYTKYFNQDRKRTGRLFESTFKASSTESDEQLIHVSRYIHLNPLVANITTNLLDYPWSSYLYYVNNAANTIVHPELIKGFFKNGEEYQKFVLDQELYGKELNKIKHLTFD